MNRGLKPEERRGLMSSCIVAVDNLMPSFLYLQFFALRYLRTIGGCLLIGMTEALCLLLGQWVLSACGVGDVTPMFVKIFN